MKETDLYMPIKETGPFASMSFWYEIGTAHWSLGRRRIDMVTITDNSLISIEVKIHDWHSVLRQASFNLYAADYSYAAIWHKTIPRVNMNLFSNRGIGVLEVSDCCREVIPAKQSNRVDDYKNRYVRAQCIATGSGGAM